MQQDTRRATGATATRKTTGERRLTKRRAWPLAAFAGVVSAAVLLAVAEVVALLVAKESSMVLALGSFVIDIIPPWAKTLVIDLFGSQDKLVLLLSLGLAVLLAAAIAGVLQLIRPPLGIVILGIAALLSGLAIITRTGATSLASVPTIVGAIAGSAVLAFSVTALRRWRDASLAAPAAAVTEGTATVADSTGAGRRNVDRRRFFQLTLISAAAAAVVGSGARLLNSTTGAVDAFRSSLRLTTKSTVPIPAGAELNIPGLSPLFTPNADFYRVDTALTVPVIDATTWRLKITGLVDNDLELSFQDILDMETDEFVTTMTCVSNEVGADLVGSARWIGVPIRDILARVGVQSGADMVLSTSVDGWTAGTPLEALNDPGRNAILAVGMNGEPLPLEHGFPVRMIVPGLYGYVSATKWLTELKVTTFADDEGYWTPRSWSPRGPIKMSSRVDTPRADRQIAPGATKVAGVAWAQHTGIEAVEVQIDNGEWQRATLSAAVNVDTWVQWVLDWEATTGVHFIAVRAIDKDGNLQIEERVPPIPNGSSGWQKALVSVTA
jgi:DMSO/TMAO reductase YedYZ molybdopterin-dependent catalytic subunit